MKKYYLHNGIEQQGAFDIEDLRAKNITKETPIWHEGLSEWTTAGKIMELDELFKQTTPPPFEKKITPPPIQEPATKQTVNIDAQPKKKSKTGLVFIILAGLITAFVVIFFINNNSSSSGNSGYEIGGDTYQEKIMTIEEIERSQPTNFLSADGTYNETFFGDKIKVHGVIKNTATVATYKDAVVKVTYYSKTKTDLGSNNYTIYDNFPANSETKFELKIENYKDVNSIGWNVIEATAN